MLYAFDFLYLDGHELRSMEYTSRWHLLEDALDGIHMRKIMDKLAWKRKSPHQTTPLSLLKPDMTPEEVHDVLSRFYTTEVDLVEQHFTDSVDRYNLDEQVWTTFHEALKCHRAGFYRATVRLLFPEIERGASVQLYGGKRKRIASLPEFADKVGRLPLGTFPHVQTPLNLFKTLEGHMYMSVWDDAPLLQAAADSVPNLHAAIHGFVEYKTMPHSMNALIMADFIFRFLGR
ncbi:hypothetical protein ASD31_19555 [Rhizobium sp. Root482]|nr:hypothetical protein ASD31_19555 [Rhizobium sp. Root482]